MKLMHTGHDPLNRYADLAGEVHLLFLAVWQELVQRRIQETNGGWKAAKGFEDTEEGGSLGWQKRGEGVFAVGQSGRENHLTHGVDPVAFKEHVFCAAKTDSDGPEGDCV